jgi:hypothetical protein
MTTENDCLLKNPGGIDPTANVKALVDLNMRRQDDLRDAASRRSDDLAAMQTGHIKEMLSLRSEASNAISALSASYSETIRIQEQMRINAMREVDNGAVSVASEKANQQAIVLAGQVAQSADALRTLVATTAQATAQASQTAMSQMGERLAALEEANYKGLGKSTVQDPMLEKLFSKLDKMSDVMSTGQGNTSGRDKNQGTLLSIAAVMIALLGVGYAIIHGQSQIVVAPPTSISAPSK